jgi:hypothetical protein
VFALVTRSTFTSRLRQYGCRASALAGVDAKLRRAQTHLDTLRAELAELVNVTLKGATAHRLDDDPYDPEWSLLRWTGVPPLDPMIGAVLGDFAHNVRSGLDQLVWVLAQLNGATPGRHTYWPIFADSGTWQDKIAKPAAKGKVTATRGISKHALALVERLQPFRLNAHAVTESPLLRVHDLWNVDKHRTVHDIRDSPALNVAAQLQLQGAVVRVTDPAAVANSRRLWPQLDYADTAEEAAERADAVLVLTEWRQYRELDPVEFGKVVKQKRVLDGRNALDRDAWEAAGWAYRALGRRVG